jgi:hypothetical protein
MSRIDVDAHKLVSLAFEIDQKDAEIKEGRQVMTVDEALREAQKWLDYLEVQKAKTNKMQELARLAKTDSKEAQHQMSQMDKQPIVYDGAKLADGVSVMIAEIERLRSALSDWLDCADIPEEWMRCRHQAKLALGRDSVENKALTALKEDQGTDNESVIGQAEEDNKVVIERLNKMLRYKGYGQGEIDAYVDQCEDIERLREALKKIAKNQYGLQALQEDGADEAAVSKYFSDMAFRFQQIARAALAATEELE